MARAHAIRFTAKLPNGSANPFESTIVFKEIEQALRDNNYKAEEPRIDNHSLPGRVIDRVVSFFGGARSWSWYLDSVESKDAQYMVGAWGSEDKSQKNVVWVVLIEKACNPLDRLYGRKMMQTDDHLSAHFEALIRKDKGNSDVSIDKNA